MIVLGLAMLGIAAAFLSGLFIESEEIAVQYLWTLSPVFIAIAGYSFWAATWTMQLYENGVVLGNKDLHFREISSYVYDSSERYASGIYWGSHTRLIFKSSLQGKPTINFAWLWFWSDPAVEEFHIRLTDVLSERILKRLAAGKSYAWTDKISLEQRGMVTKKGLVRYADIEIEPIHIFTRSVFIFKDTGRNKKIGEIDFNTPNMFPVLEVIETLAVEPKPTVDPISPQPGRGTNYHPDRLSF